MFIVILYRHIHMLGALLFKDIAKNMTPESKLEVIIQLHCKT